MLLAAAWRSSVTRGLARATPTATVPARGYYNGGHGYYRPYYGYRPYYPYYPYYYGPGVSLSFGWGYGSTWPYYGGAASGGPATR